MKYFCFLAIIFISCSVLDAQNISIFGKIVNTDNEPIAGATVGISGQNKTVNSNADGEYVLTNLQSGKIAVNVSFAGYESKTVEFNLQQNGNNMDFKIDENDTVTYRTDKLQMGVNVTLHKKPVALEAVTITTQRRTQQIFDVPATVSVISSGTLESTNIRSLELLSDFIPGFNARVQTPHRPLFVIRGLTSDDVSPTSQPRVSVYYNDVPVNRIIPVQELYDMERIEVVKGPQGTLFGRGSQIGAINFISRKPSVSGFDGYLSAGFGNYAMKEFEGALNIPVIKDKLAARAAAIYSFQDGYVKNTSGGTLNGKNTVAGRFSARYTPSEKLKIDLTLNYQKDDHPGTAFMSKRYPNVNGVKDIFKYEASLDAGKEWFTRRELFGASIDAQYYISKNSYLTSITSYHSNSAEHRWDGDGSIAPAIDMAETDDTRQFTQELKYNFSINSRINGFLGISYWREEFKQKYWFGPDEQYMAYLLFQMPEYMLNPDGSLGYPIPSIPDLGDPRMGQLVGMSIPNNHQEESTGGAVNQAADIFADATFLLLPKLSLTAGIRLSAENFLASTEAHLKGEVPSTLGYLTQMAPNFFFAQKDYTEFNKDFLSFTWRASLKYDINPNTGIWAGYAKGRRPNVLQFNSAGENEVISSEQLHSFEAGLKWNIAQRYWFDAGIFYQLYSDFQTSKWVNGNYEVDDAGNATSYGFEATAKAFVNRYLDLFGNYAYIHARFDKLNSDGAEQEYGGKTFRLTPEHSFMLGLNLKADISNNLRIILTPTYSYRSHIWFEDSNEMQPEDPSLDRLEQGAYGLLNANLALKMRNPGLTLSLFGTNLTDTKYIIGAGNTGMMFGVPTYVPGAPRMFGVKLRYDF
ncbi:MAG: TonB-dependent receptor [Prevotellaceae bacterium]|nr:TonB-dependent receptor [Prevotellaceae bacterium]